MPKKSKKSPSLSSVSASWKSGRGRPRKYVDPDALIPSEMSRITADADCEKRKKKYKLMESKHDAQRTSPVTSDRCYSADEVEFMNALSEFKRSSGRTFPTCSEILGILRGLGYEKAQEQAEPELVDASRPLHF